MHRIASTKEGITHSMLMLIDSGVCATTTVMVRTFQIVISYMKEDIRYAVILTDVVILLDSSSLSL